MQSPDELKQLVEEQLEALELWPELHGQAESVRYSLEVGGKRVRPVIALAVGEALGAPVEQVMPAALANELVGDVLDFTRLRIWIALVKIFDVQLRFR